MRDTLSDADPTVSALLADERRRQDATLSLIASENCASPAVLAAQGTCLTNKYAEGRPGSRYYAGCEHVDDLERLAERRACALWGADHADVQPHSGSQANMAAYLALLDAGDAILSLSLTDGGHLSHGHDASFASEYYDVAHYRVEEATGRLDYDAIEERAHEVDPDLVVAGYSAYPRVVDWAHFRDVADAVDAALLADMAHLTGLIAADRHPSPVGVADVVTGSTHKTIRAGRGGLLLADDDDLADDLHHAVMPGAQGGPLLHNVAGKAVGFGEALAAEPAADREGVAAAPGDRIDPDFEAYVDRVLDTAAALADRLQERGFDVVSGGTDVHFALVDLRETHPDLTGREVEDALDRAGLVANRSNVPGDHRPSYVGSGVRLGTPAPASRGIGVDEIRRIADWLADVIEAQGDDVTSADATIERVRGEVRELCAAFPKHPDDPGEPEPPTDAADPEAPER